MKYEKQIKEKKLKLEEQQLRLEEQQLRRGTTIKETNGIKRNE